MSFKLEYVCDKCKVVQKDEPVMLKVHYPNYIVEDTYHLCTSCFEQFESWLKKNER